MQAPRGKQFKFNGNIVSVPADVTNSVSLLPRLPNEACTTKVNLKRLQYKISALSLNVRPHKVVQAAKWLINNSALYKHEGIALCENWQNSQESDLITQFMIKVSVILRWEPPTHADSETLSTFNEEKWCDDSDDWSENETECPAGVTDTMLTSTDFVEDNERQYILNLAPAEGSRPLSVFRDKFSEEMAYTGIFLGQGRPENDKRLTPVHYSEIYKSELRRSHRRAAMCVENIFFDTKKIQMEILLGKSQIAGNANQIQQHLMPGC